MEMIKNIVEEGKTFIGLGPIDWGATSKVEDMFHRLDDSKTRDLMRNTAEPISNRELIIGSAGFQLYSNGSPDGQKVNIVVEELDIDYDAHNVNIIAKEHLTSGFISVNPNGKVPAAVDLGGPNGDHIRLFESNAIMLYLAEKHGKLIPQDAGLKAELINWLFWQSVNLTPSSQCFMHYWWHTETNLKTRDYGCAKYGMEVQRMCSLLDIHLRAHTYIVGEEYSIADIACFTWYQALRSCILTQGGTYIKDFLSLETAYPNLVLWANRILSRPAVQKGMSLFPNTLMDISCLPATSKVEYLKTREEDVKEPSVTNTATVPPTNYGTSQTGHVPVIASHDRDKTLNVM